MPFISRKKREKLVGKINSGVSFKKFYILITLFCTLIVCAAVVFGLCGQLGIFSNDEVNKFLAFVNDKDQLTTYGIVFVVFLGISGVGGFFSIFLVASMPSPKKISKLHDELISAPLSGKKTKNKSVASQAIKRKVIEE